jgi:hypothetical protein
MISAWKKKMVAKSIDAVAWLAGSAMLGYLHLDSPAAPGVPIISPLSPSFSPRLFSCNWYRRVR